MMTRQVDYQEIAPDASEGIGNIGDFVNSSDLDAYLVEFVKLRASQLNNCAYCVDLHTRKAKELGEDDRRIASVSAWRESPFFSDRERAALALTEALTQMGCEPVPEGIFEEAWTQFEEETLVALVMTIVQINSWNRLWVTFNKPDIPDL